MIRHHLALLVCLAFGVGTVALAQDKKKDDTPPTKPGEAKKEDPKKDDAKKDDGKKEEVKKETPGRVRGMLPANYRKLGLTDEQKNKIYRLQAEYDDKIKEAEERLAKLKAERSKVAETVLTDAQKARLKEILAGKDKDK